MFLSYEFFIVPYWSINPETEHFIEIHRYKKKMRVEAQRIHKNNKGKYRKKISLYRENRSALGWVKHLLKNRKGTVYQTAFQISF